VLTACGYPKAPANRHHGRVNAPDGFVKVRFRLEVDEEGWPPVGSEGMWAEPVADDVYRIDNIPWFVPNIAADDLVRAEAGDDGVLWAIEKIQWSGRLTIRVIPFQQGPLHGDRQAVLDAFAPVGVSGEGVEQYGLIALDVPADVPFRPVWELLKRGVDLGWWDFDEGCVGDEWLSIGQAKG
jgi:hypothetical protein